MKVTEEVLLASGFSPAELQIIKRNAEIYGNSLDVVTNDLANRFIMVISIISFCLIVFIFLILFGSAESIFSGTTGVACGIAVAAFAQPLLLACKAWRFRKVVRRNSL